MVSLEILFREAVIRMQCIRWPKVFAARALKPGNLCAGLDMVCVVRREIRGSGL